MCNKYTPGKFNALIQGKCPRCQSGKIFVYKATNLKKFTVMMDECPVCHLRYEIEPGFFWGAMYVSYAITTAMMITLGAAVFLLGHDPDFWVYGTTIISAIILSSPFVYRYSRVGMLYWFSPVRFDESLANK